MAVAAAAATFVLISMILTLFVFLRYFGRICAHNDVPLRILKYHRISFIPIQFFLFSLFIYRLWFFLFLLELCGIFLCSYLCDRSNLLCWMCTIFVCFDYQFSDEKKNIVDKRVFSLHTSGIFWSFKPRLSVKPAKKTTDYCPIKTK